MIIKFGGVRLESNILGFFFHVFLSHLLDESGFYFILLNSFVIESHARILSTGAGPCPFYLLTFIWFKLLLQRVWSILQLNRISLVQILSIKERVVIHVCWREHGIIRHQKVPSLSHRPLIIRINLVGTARISQ